MCIFSIAVCKDLNPSTEGLLENISSGIALKGLIQQIRKYYEALCHRTGTLFILKAVR